MDGKLFELFEVEVESKRSKGNFVAMVTHGVPLHADDIVSIDLISSEATLEWVQKNQDKEGVIQLDMPGSKFSDKDGIKEKAVDSARKKEAMCIKVARSLGVLHSPRWKKILECVNRDDTRAHSDQTSIVSLLKHGQNQNPARAMEICQWFLNGLCVKLELANGNKNFVLSEMSRLMRENASRIDFSVEEWIEEGERINLLRGRYFSLAKKELKEKRKAGKLLLKKIKHGGRKITIAAIESINYRMQAVMRAKQRDGSRLADVVIVKGLGGALVNHCQDAGIDIREAVAAIRYMEAWKNEVILKNDWRVLREPGTADIAPAWFFNTQSTPKMLMNSLSHDAPRSALSLQEIFEGVVIALDEERFHPRPDIKNFCRNGVCKLGFKCPNLQMGIVRCVKNYIKGGR